MSAARRAQPMSSADRAPVTAETTVAAGGPVAALQLTLAQRLAAQGVPPALAAPYAPDPIEAIVSGVSRWTGFAAFGVAAVTTAWVLFG